MSRVLKAVAIAAGAVAGVASSFLGLDFATAAAVGFATTGAVTVAGRFTGQKVTSDIALVASSAAGVAAAYTLAKDPTEALTYALSGPGAAVLFSAAANLGHDGAKTTHDGVKRGQELADQARELGRKGLTEAKKRTGYNQ